MNTRTRAVIVSITITVLFFITRVVNSRLLGDLDAVTRNNLIYLAQLIVIAAALTVGVSWVLFFKINRKFLITGAMLPFFLLVPFWQLLEVIANFFSYNIGVSPDLSSIISYAIIGLLLYIFVLMVNLLNGARLSNIPLGQAAKAFQFIFTLIASYLFFSFAFGSGQLFVILVPMVFIYIGYLTLSGVQILNLRPRQEQSLAILVAGVIAISFLVISLWPVAVVYAALIMTIIYYLVLNLALEMREKISSYVWIEYFLLIALVVIILVANSIWGVNGTIF